MKVSPEYLSVTTIYIAMCAIIRNQYYSKDTLTY